LKAGDEAKPTGMKDTDISEHDKTGVIRQVVYRIGVGTVGSLILVFFLMGLVSISGAVSFMPWSIGFNAALTGYTLLDKTRNRLKHKRIVILGAGLSVGGAACLALNVTGVYLMGDVLLSVGELIYLPLIGIACSGFGAWLAMKYLHLE
jgi:hypothetical protein